MLEKDQIMEIPTSQRMERQQTLAKEHSEEYRAALQRAVTLSVPHAYTPFQYGTFDEGDNSSESSGKSSSWYTTTLSNVPINSGQYFKLLTNTASSNDTYTGDYILVKKSKTNITISDAGWATLYTPNALDFSSLSEDVTAYTATCTDGVVTLTAVDDVPANTGVVLKGAAATYSIPVIASSETEKGDLTGSATATAFNAYDGYTLYMLKKVGDNAQFVPVTSGSVAAGKAFLKIANAGEARSLSVVFADETTGISTVNGEGFKANGSHYFDLQGRRVVNPASGLYIVSGKKVIVK